MFSKWQDDGTCGCNWSHIWCASQFSAVVRDVTRDTTRRPWFPVVDFSVVRMSGYRTGGLTLFAGIQCSGKVVGFYGSGHWLSMPDRGQHSFYQLLHQGRVVPSHFIGFAASQHPATRLKPRWSFRQSDLSDAIFGLKLRGMSSTSRSMQKWDVFVEVIVACWNFFCH